MNSLSKRLVAGRARQNPLSAPSNLSAIMGFLAAACLGSLAGCVAGANVAKSAANPDSTVAAQTAEASTVNLAAKGTDSTEASASHLVPVVLPTAACTNLGAPGTWQNITPSGYNADYRPSAFVVDKNSGLVYVGTDSFNDGNSKGVQRSTDCGNTWVHVSTGKGSNAINGGRQWAFAINDRDGRIIYTNSGYYKLGLFKSYDGGVDWRDVTPRVDGAPGFAGNLQMDPDNSDHLLLTWHGPCAGPNNQFTFVDQVGCFHESKDGGRTWKGHYGDGTKWPPEVRVLLLHGSTWIVLAGSALYTTDGGKTYKVVSGSALGGHSSGNLSRANNGALFIGTQFGAYYSSPSSDGQDWTAAGGQWVGEIADTGSLLYETEQNASLQTSPSADGVHWRPVAGGPANCVYARYDALHKVLYVSCGANGFWRLVVE